MEHSRIILGEKVYKELNPTSKEKKHTPTLWLTAISCPLYSYFSLIYIFYLYPFLHPLLHPLLRIGLVE
jgi:hypothetical protein